MCLGLLLRAAFPRDRPSPLFSLVTQCLNSGVVIYGFQTVLSTDCSNKSSKVISFGIFNGLVNMIFASSIIFLTRRKISRGISSKESTYHLFLTDPVIILYLLCLAWEVSWFFWIYTAPPSEECSSAILLQVVLLGISILVGFLLFMFTFSTERCRLPQWRVVAAERWEEQNHEWSISGDGESEPSEEYSHRNQVLHRSRERNSTLSGSTGSFDHHTISYSSEYSTEQRHTALSSTFERSNSMATPSVSWR